MPLVFEGADAKNKTSVTDLLLLQQLKMQKTYPRHPGRSPGKLPGPTLSSPGHQTHQCPASLSHLEQFIPSFVCGEQMLEQ